MSLEDIIRSLTDRIRRLESGQEGNGFVPYLFPVRYGSNNLTVKGLHTAIKIGVGESAYMEMTMPRKVESLSEAILIYIPDGTGTWDYTVNTNGGYCEEAHDAEADGISDDGEPTVDDRIQCLDISDALTPFSVGDIIGLRVICDALDTTVGLWILGARLR